MKYNPDLKDLAKKIERIIDYARNTPGPCAKVETQIITHVGIITIKRDGWDDVKLIINQGYQGASTFCLEHCEAKSWYDDGDKNKDPWTMLDILETMEDFAVAGFE